MADDDENGMLVHALDVDLEKFAEKLDLAVEVVMKRIVLDLFRRITKRTPVDTGRARASWDVKVGSPSAWIPPETKESVAGTGKTRLGAGLAGNALGVGGLSGGTVKEVGSAIEEIDGTQTVFITTALDYMQYLEKGSSAQAPSGMVVLSISEVEIEIESILDQL